LGIEGKEFKFILDIEYQLTKNWKANKVGKEFFEFYKNLTKIGEHPWLIIEKNHVKKLSFNYFNWKFLRESSELMSSISKLEYVELFLSIIKKYNIDYSIIKSIPQSIGNLSELKSLNLSYNNLTKIPKSIVRLDKLRILNLSHNNLKTLPDISSMKRLRDLNLSHNNFNEIPHSVEKVKNTLNLNIDSNPIR
jgi:Leucine-rich repeat (LRR) protein